MGLFAGKYDHARLCHAPDRRDDPRTARAVLRHVRGWLASGLTALALATAAGAETYRFATYNTELSRDGPGLLLRDLVRGKDPQIDAVLQVIAAADADVLVIQNFDYDLTAEALSRFADAAGYAHFFALRPNTGLATDFDMDGDGRLGGPRDAQGYGRFTGQGGMAVLSRFPILENRVQDFSGLLWEDVPDALLPEVDGTPFPSAAARAALRLSTTGHWSLPVDLPTGAADFLVFHAGPPVFDGPEDRNGKRNHDEIVFWQHLLDGRIGAAPIGPFVLAGNANIDPLDGEGIKAGINRLLQDPRLQNAPPSGHAGTDTVDWSDLDLGQMRVSYVLPSTHWRIADSGVLWPAPSEALAEVAAAASRHRLVWVDLALSPPAE